MLLILVFEARVGRCLTCWMRVSRIFCFLIACWSHSPQNMEYTSGWRDVDVEVNPKGHFRMPSTILFSICVDRFAKWHFARNHSEIISCLMLLVYFHFNLQYVLSLWGSTAILLLTSGHRPAIIFCTKWCRSQRPFRLQVLHYLHFYLVR